MSNQSGEAWLVRRVADWPHSTFHKLVKAGVYPPEWAGGMADALGYDDWHAAQCAALIAPYPRYKFVTVRSPEGAQRIPGFCLRPPRNTRCSFRATDIAMQRTVGWVEAARPKPINSDCARGDGFRYALPILQVRRSRRRWA